MVADDPDLRGPESGEFTVVVVFRCEVAPGTGAVTFVRKNTDYICRLEENVGAYTYNGYWWDRAGDAADSKRQVIFEFGYGVPHFVGFVFAGDVAAGISMEGLPLGGTLTSLALGDRVDEAFYLGGSATPEEGYAGRIEAVLLYRRALSNAELSTLAADPFAFATEAPAGPTTATLSAPDGTAGYTNPAGIAANDLRLRVDARRPGRLGGRDGRLRVLRRHRHVPRGGGRGGGRGAGILRGPDDGPPLAAGDDAGLPRRHDRRRGAGGGRRPAGGHAGGPDALAVDRVGRRPRPRRPSRPPGPGWPGTRRRTRPCSRSRPGRSPATT